MVKFYVQHARSPSLAIARLQGVTMIELLSVVVIAMLLLVVAIPTFQTIRVSQQQSAALNQTFAVLQYARSLAMAEATQVILCGSSDRATCNGIDNLANGAVIMARAPDNSLELKRAIDPIKSGGFVIQLNGFAQSDRLVFDDIGEIERLNGIASVSFCDDRGTDAGAALIINPLGMVRLATDDDDDDRINLHDQSNLACA